MSKAYDCMEWIFLQFVINRMGLNSVWIDFIMRCVTFISYFILINGHPQPSFKPSRGFRQGDPFSPYIFILYAEGLSRLLFKVESKGSIFSVSLAMGL